MQSTIETFWALFVGTFALLSLVVGFIFTTVSYQRRRILLQQEKMEELRKSEEKYRNLFNNALVGMYRSDVATGAVIEANDALLRILGVVSIEEIGTMNRFIDPEDRKRFYDQLADRHAVENFETRVQRSDGTSAWISLSGKVFAAEGHIEGAVADITSRKIALARIEEQAALLDKAQDAILVCDLDQRITYWNKSAERLYGWSSDDVIGKRIGEILHNPAEAAAYGKARETLLRAGEWNGELLHVHKGGKDVVVDSRWTLVRDQSQAPRQILIVETDITERKKLQEQFLRAQRMESIGILASGIAHDLNNVLAPIALSIGLLEEKIKDVSAQRVLMAIQSSAKRGADMVKQVLLFARGIDSPRMMLQPKHLLQEIFKIVGETFPKSIQILIQAPEATWTVSGDSTQLHQVFLNLCVNARDALPNGGTLTMAVENVTVDEQFARTHRDAKTGSYVVFTFRDTGFGIPPEHLNRIFEPFFTTKEFGKGTGLGLSTAHGIVRSHEGFMEVRSSVGVGTTFYVYIPASQVIESIDTEEPVEPVTEGQGELILLVDDEEAILEVTREILEHRGYKVVTARDGSQAVAIFQERNREIDLVLTDMMMPSLGGGAMIKALKKIDPESKIIASSGLMTPFDQNSMQDDVSAVLMKPYSEDALLMTLDRVLARPRNPAA